MHTCANKYGLQGGSDAKTCSLFNLKNMKMSIPKKKKHSQFFFKQFLLISPKKYYVIIKYIITIIIYIIIKIINKIFYFSFTKCIIKKII